MNIEERIEKLERGLLRARRTNVGLSIILCLAVAVMISGAAVEEKKTEAAVKEIRAQKIVLEDEKGKVRVRLDATGDQKGLHLMDESGLPRLQLGSFGSNLGLYIKDKTDKGCTYILVNENDASFVLSSGNGGSIDLISDNEPALSISDPNNRSRIFLGLLARSKIARLDIHDESGKPRFTQDVINNLSMQCLYDRNGNKRITQVIDDDGARSVIVDQNGHVRACLGWAKTGTPDGKATTYPESNLVMFGPDDKVLWQAPR